jgi:hypothetical protein
VVVTAGAGVESDGVLVLALVLQLPREVVGGGAVPGLLHDLRGLVEVALLVRRKIRRHMVSTTIHIALHNTKTGMEHDATTCTDNAANWAACTVLQLVRTVASLPATNCKTTATAGDAP